jgi:putative two-component system response regulator
MNAARRILIVDDEVMNRKLLDASLKRLGYVTEQAEDGVEALEKAHLTHPELIILDILMPRMDGYETARRLKSDEKTQTIPILVVSSQWDVEFRVKAFEAGADDFLAKPVDQTELKARVQSLLKLKSYNDHMIKYQKVLETEVASRTDELKRAYDQLKQAALDTIFRLSQAAEFKDHDTGNHSIRIGYYSAAIARRLGLGDTMVDNMLHAAPMHDIGKIGVPDNILLKPGKLTETEWVVMKQHSDIGGRLLAGSDSDVIQLAEEIAMSHHERSNGDGYPYGLRNDKIPLSGRIVAVADVFDALTSRRPYKEAFSIGKSFSIIEDMVRASQLDPEIAAAFFDIESEIIAIREQNPQ